eukprot:CAMPEP_0119309702 /NCGR_PEP_ID=MMETSP1333-20130426/16115_1 /TAXON_ID=418940 /ORGANISM="Scyphosphaera apsteinii, Strain RCC1455" /LENGTH=156 /DNA_ID=CAMNT_0007313715 /DNA_START=102 /DNA_END=572 /DNA_ORIENTATION=+
MHLLPEVLISAASEKGAFTDAELLGISDSGSDPAFGFFTAMLIASVAWNLSQLNVDGDTMRNNDPDGYEAQLRKFGKLSDSERLSQFGWLHADLRTPLPTLDELQSSCHLVGVREGHQMYLCSKESMATTTICSKSEDFSEYYGTEVYICKGNRVQ